MHNKHTTKWKLQPGTVLVSYRVHGPLLKPTKKEAPGFPGISRDCPDAAKTTFDPKVNAYMCVYVGTDGILKARKKNFFSFDSYSTKTPKSQR